MVIYADVVMGLNFGVDFLLLCASNRLSGYPSGCGRAALAAAVGSIYAGACLFIENSIFESGLCHVVSLVVVALLAFGVRRSALRRGVLFVLLSMALGGTVFLLGSESFWGILASGACVMGLCVAGFRGQAGNSTYVPVQLCYGDRCLHITALRDTGNSLLDPVSGQSVLIVDHKVAQRLTGLTREELQDPVGAMGRLPGLRLIPYKTVGQPGGLLLGLKISNVKIGDAVSSRLVAFAPDSLSADGEYEALTGGVL